MFKTFSVSDRSEPATFTVPQLLSPRPCEVRIASWALTRGDRTSAMLRDAC